MSRSGRSAVQPCSLGTGSTWLAEAAWGERAAAGTGAAMGTVVGAAVLAVEPSIAAIAAAVSSVGVGLVLRPVGGVVGITLEVVAYAKFKAAAGTAVGAMAHVAVPATAGTELVSAERPAQGASAQPLLKLLIKSSAESESLSCRSSTGGLTT